MCHRPTRGFGSDTYSNQYAWVYASRTNVVDNLAATVYDDHCVIHVSPPNFSTPITTSFIRTARRTSEVFYGDIYRIINKDEEGLDEHLRMLHHRLGRSGRH